MDKKCILSGHCGYYGQAVCRESSICYKSPTELKDAIELFDEMFGDNDTAIKFRDAWKVIRKNLPNEVML